MIGDEDGDYYYYRLRVSKDRGYIGNLLLRTYYTSSNLVSSHQKISLVPRPELLTRLHGENVNNTGRLILFYAEIFVDELN